MDDLIAPAEPLRSLIEGYWRRSGTYDPPKQVRVLADACTKMIFELEPMTWSSAYLLPTQLDPIIVTLADRVDRIGVRFRPGTASFLIGRPLDGIGAPFAPLESLGIADGETLRLQLKRAESGVAQARILDAWLLARLPSEDGAEELEQVLNVADLLRQGLPAPAVAASLGWPEWRLQRLCRKRFGAPAATLARLFRFERLHRRLHGRPAVLADLAAELGFADQAHMSREFRQFGGTTISAYLRERAAVGNLQDAAAWLPVLRDLAEEF